MKLPKSSQVKNRWTGSHPDCEVYDGQDTRDSAAEVITDSKKGTWCSHDTGQCRTCRLGIGWCKRRGSSGHLRLSPGASLQPGAAALSLPPAPSMRPRNSAAAVPLVKQGETEKGNSVSRRAEKLLEQEKMLARRDWTTHQVLLEWRADMESLHTVDRAARNLAGRWARGSSDKWEKRSKTPTPQEFAAALQVSRQSASRETQLKQQTKPAEEHPRRSQQLDAIERGPSPPQRVCLWNTLTLKRLTGQNRPRRRDLENFLRRHPHYELYTGQDGMGGEVVEPSPHSTVSGASWSVGDDNALAKVIERLGVPSGREQWGIIAQALGSGRSQKSVETRWYRYHKEKRQRKTRTEGESVRESDNSVASASTTAMDGNISSDELPRKTLCDEPAAATDVKNQEPTASSRSQAGTEAAPGLASSGVDVECTAQDIAQVDGPVKDKFSTVPLSADCLGTEESNAAPGPPTEAQSIETESTVATRESYEGEPAKQPQDPQLAISSKPPSAAAGKRKREASTDDSHGAAAQENAKATWCSDENRKCRICRLDVGWCKWRGRNGHLPHSESPKGVRAAALDAASNDDSGDRVAADTQQTPTSALVDSDAETVDDSQSASAAFFTAAPRAMTPPPKTSLPGKLGASAAAAAECIELLDCTEDSEDGARGDVGAPLVEVHSGGQQLRKVPAEVTAKPPDAAGAKSDRMDGQGLEWATVYRADDNEVTMLRKKPTVSEKPDVWVDSQTTVRDGERVAVIEIARRGGTPGFCRIRTASGAEGWLKQSFLVTEDSETNAKTASHETSGGLRPTAPESAVVSSKGDNRDGQGIAGNLAYAVGQRLSMRFDMSDGSQGWYPGTIAKVHAEAAGSRRFDITFDDGGVEKNVCDTDPDLVIEWPVAADSAQADAETGVKVQKLQSCKAATSVESEAAGRPQKRKRSISEVYPPVGTQVRVKCKDTKSADTLGRAQTRATIDKWGGQAGIVVGKRDTQRCRACSCLILMPVS